MRIHVSLSALLTSYIKCRHEIVVIYLFHFNFSKFTIKDKLHAKCIFKILLRLIQKKESRKVNLSCSRARSNQNLTRYWVSLSGYVISGEQADSIAVIIVNTWWMMMHTIIAVERDTCSLHTFAIRSLTYSYIFALFILN